MPAASKNVGIVLTFSGAAARVASHSEDGVEEVLVGEEVHVGAVAGGGGCDAAPEAGQRDSARVHVPLCRGVSDVSRLRTLSRVSTSTRSRVVPDAGQRHPLARLEEDLERGFAAQEIVDGPPASSAPAR